uniref:Tripartite motif-containing protein 16-like protein n=1 Tax=Paramormyrops kingsleyae TaxID=1676925 RepID=A0A3B3R523_9TELE|nr:tripartite motif-containing protein 16-like protein [Paramormyrops kingsleyae]
MASLGCSELEFNCSVCLETLHEPATLPCGHTYCLPCIQSHWDRGEAKKVYSCPQCRQTFSPRPRLAKNTLLVEAMEKLKIRVQEVSPAPICLAAPSLPCAPLGDEMNEGPGERSLYPKLPGNPRLCPDHQRPLDLFCRNDQQCICNMCKNHEHKGHCVVSPEEEKKEKEREVAKMLADMQGKIQQKERDLQRLPQTARMYKDFSQALQRESGQIFAELVLNVEQMSTQVNELLCSRESAASTSCEGQIQRLEQEVAQLRRRDEELHWLMRIQDSVCFLKNFQMLEAPFQDGGDMKVGADSEDALRAVKAILVELRVKLQELLKASTARLLQALNDTGPLPPVSSNAGAEGAQNEVRQLFQMTVSGASASSSPPALEPKTRDELLKYRFEPTLDLNTAYRHIRVSEKDRKATLRAEIQGHPEHPDRFQYWRQILCREPLAGSPYYWEVEWNGQKITVGVTYKELGRKGSDDSCRLGHNNQSWGLYWSGTGFSVWHSGKETTVTGPKARRIGVYVDQQMGILAFYGVFNNQVQLLHVVQASFSGPLYPGFRFWSGAGSSITLCELD